MKALESENTATEDTKSGFVEFFTVADAKYAMEMVNGTTIGGHMVKFALQYNGMFIIKKKNIPETVVLNLSMIN